MSNPASHPDDKRRELLVTAISQCSVRVGGRELPDDERAMILDAMRAQSNGPDRSDVLRQIRFELAALVADPSNPNWMPALTNGNPADAECLTKAYALCATKESSK